MAAMRFAGQEITVIVDDRARRHAMPVFDFVQPHFSVESTESPSSSSLMMEVLPLAVWREPTNVGRVTPVRRARTQAKHLWGTRWHEAGRTTIAVPSSQTAFDLADDGSDARVYVSDTSHYHVTDFLREIFWELAASSGVGIFVHAAAVSDGSSVVAFTGDKGAGKTTTALDFIHMGADFYSGDVLFMNGDGSVVYNFPDYPGVCWGTLRAYPRLLEAALDVGFSPDPDDGQKVLLPHDFYCWALGTRKAPPPSPLRAVVLACITAPREGRLVVSPPERHLLKPMHRKTIDPAEGWQPFLAAVAGCSRRSTAGGAVSSMVKEVRPEVRWFVRLGLGRLGVDQVEEVLGHISTRSRRTGGE